MDVLHLYVHVVLGLEEFAAVGGAILGLEGDDVADCFVEELDGHADGRRHVVGELFAADVSLAMLSGRVLLGSLLEIFGVTTFGHVSDLWCRLGWATYVSEASV